MKKWTVRFHKNFEPEFDKLNVVVQDELMAHALFLEKVGPQLGRPYVDTLKNSKFANMKELRFNALNGVWRVACGVWLLLMILKDKRYS